MSIKIALTLFYVVFIVSARKLPPGIKPCSRNEPDLSACALKHARLAIPIVVNGIPEYGVVQMDPLYIGNLEATEPNQSGAVSFSLVMTNVNLYGLKNLQFEYFNISKDIKNINYRAFIPQLELTGGFNTSGRILMLPIVGNGDLNVKLENVTIDVSYSTTIVKHEDGIEYMTVDYPEINFDVSSMHFEELSLFGPNNTVGMKIDEIMNENWEIILEDMGPKLSEPIKKAAYKASQQIIKDVPYNDIYPDAPPATQP